MSFSCQENVGQSTSPEIVLNLNAMQTPSPSSQKSRSNAAHYSNQYEVSTLSGYAHYPTVPHPQIDHDHNSSQTYLQSTQKWQTTASAIFQDTGFVDNASDRFVCEHCEPEKRTVCRSLKDLERHTKSVHQVYHKGDKFWMCPVLGCARASKKWPRLDNFTSHVERMHPRENTKDVVNRALFVTGEDQTDLGKYFGTPESGYMSATESLDFDQDLACDYVFGSSGRFEL